MAPPQGTPLYATGAFFSPDPRSRFPLIYSIGGGTVNSIDYRPYANYTTPSGSAPANPSTTGDGLSYPTSVATGAPGTPTTATPAANVYGCAICAPAGRLRNNPGPYHPPG